MEQLSIPRGGPLDAPRNGGRGAFTLVELLAVMAIILVVLGVTLGYSGSLFGSANLSTAGRTFSDNLDLARQLAITRNRPVELRFYSLAEPANPAVSTYHAYQFFTDPGTGNFIPETKVFYFPPNVHFYTDGDKTSLVSPGGYALTLQPPTLALPGVGTNYHYVVFHFLPTGGADLTPTKQWYVTLVRDPTNNMGSFPANFFTVKIDPISGKVTVFQP